MTSEKTKDPRENLTEELCTKCGNTFFNKLYRVYSLEGDKTASKRKEYFEVPVYVCANGDCGNIIEPN